MQVYVEDEEANGRPDAVMSRIAWEKYQKRNSSAVVDMFAGLLKSTVVCPECERVSVKFDPYMSLCLPLPTNTKRTLLIHFEPLASDMTVDPTTGRATNIARWTAPDPAHADDPRFTGASATTTGTGKAGAVHREGAPDRGKRYIMHAVTLDKQEKIRTIKPSLAAEVGIATDRLMMYRSETSSDMQIVNDVDTREVGSQYTHGSTVLYAVEMPASKTLVPDRKQLEELNIAIPHWLGASAATAAGAAADGGAAAPAPVTAGAALGGPLPEGGARGDPSERMVLLIEHFAPRGTRTALAMAIRSKMPLSAVKPVEDGFHPVADRLFDDMTNPQSTEEPGQSTLLGVPRGSTVAGVRYQLARAVWPFVNVSRWRELVDGWRRKELVATAVANGMDPESAVEAADDADLEPLTTGRLQYELARALPVAVTQSNNRAVKPHWLPSFDKAVPVGAPSTTRVPLAAPAVGDADAASCFVPTDEADARLLRIDDDRATGTVGMAPGKMALARLAVVWRGWFARILNVEQMESYSGSPSLARAIREEEER